MKVTIKVPKEIEIKYIRIDIEIRHVGEDEDDGDMPPDFPMLDSSKTRWVATVDIDTGKILNWPKGRKGGFCSKVRDNGTYTLVDDRGDIVATLKGYVPNRVVPGEYGDYVELDINEKGVITNWPEIPDVSAFFGEDEDE